MKSEIVTTYSSEDLEAIIIASLKKYEAMKAALPSNEETFSINQVAKRLGRSHSTIKRLIETGLLKTTTDQRRVSAFSLNEYLRISTD